MNAELHDAIIAELAQKPRRVTTLSDRLGARQEDVEAVLLGDPCFFTKKTGHHIMWHTRSAEEALKVAADRARVDEIRRALVDAGFPAAFTTEHDLPGLEGVSVAVQLEPEDPEDTAKVVIWITALARHAQVKVRILPGDRPVELVSEGIQRLAQLCELGVEKRVD